MNGRHDAAAFGQVGGSVVNLCIHIVNQPRYYCQLLVAIHSYPLHQNEDKSSSGSTRVLKQRYSDLADLFDASLPWQMTNTILSTVIRCSTQVTISARLLE